MFQHDHGQAEIGIGPVGPFDIRRTVVLPDLDPAGIQF